MKINGNGWRVIHLSLLAGAVLVPALSRAQDWKATLGSNRCAQVVTLGNGVWVCTWNLHDGVELNKDHVVAARSADNGMTWSRPERIKTARECAIENRERPGMTVAPDGTLSVGDGMQTCRNMDYVSDEYDTVSTLDGLSWKPVPAPVLRKTEQRLVTSPNGTRGAIYVSSDKRERRQAVSMNIYVTFARENCADFEAPVLLSTKKSPVYRNEDGSEFCLPDLATDGAGNWLAVWSWRQGFGCVFESHSCDDGRTWSECSILAASEGGLGIPWDSAVPRITMSKCCWLVSWDCQDNGGDRSLGPGLVRAVRSTDLGRTWSAEKSLNEGTEENSASSGGHTVCTDGDGHWLAVWHSRMPQPGAGYYARDTDIAFSRSDDDTETWTKPAVLNTNAFSDLGNDLDPFVATDNKGTWLTVWSANGTPDGQRASRENIFFSISADNGATWSAPKLMDDKAVTPSETDSARAGRCPHVYTDANGCWMIAWETCGGRLKYGEPAAATMISRSSDLGKTWSPPVEVSTDGINSPFSNTDLCLAVNGAGNWLAAWLRHNDELLLEHSIMTALSTDGGASWNKPTVVASRVGYRGVAVAGTASIWTVLHTGMSEDSGGPLGVQAKTSIDNGKSWGQRVVMNLIGDPEEAAYDPNPAVAVSREGHELCIWREGGYNSRNLLLIKASRDGMTWDAAVVVHEGEDDVEVTGCFAGENGHWITTWSRRKVKQTLSDTIPETTAVSCCSFDDGKSWEPPVAPASATEPLQLAYGGGGKWLGTSAAQRDCDDERARSSVIEIIESRDNGKTWDAKFHLVAAGKPAMGSHAHIAADRKGNWMIVWQTEDNHIAAQVSTDDGSSWAPCF